MTGSVRRMPKVTKGDVIEVCLSNRKFSYLQDIGPRLGVRILRFLSGIFDSSLDQVELKKLVAERSLYKAPCLVELILSKGLGRIVANLPLPESDSSMPAMVTGDWSEDQNDWWVTDSDGSEMRASEYLRLHSTLNIRELPLYNDSPGPETVIARIEGGWTPMNRVEIPQQRSNAKVNVVDRKIASPGTMYLSYFRNEESAQRFSKIVCVKNRQVMLAEREQDGLWEVSVQAVGHFDRRLALEYENLAPEFGGFYDGDLDIST